MIAISRLPQVQQLWLLMTCKTVGCVPSKRSIWQLQTV